MSTSVPGNSCRSNRCCTPPTQGCVLRLPGECVYYSGSNLSGPGINTGDNLNVVVNKLTQLIGAGFVAQNALTLTSGVLTWGGALNQATTITGSTNSDTITFQGNSNGDFLTITNSDLTGKALHVNGDVRMPGPKIYMGERSIDGTNENYFLTSTARSYSEYSTSSDPTRLANLSGALQMYLNNGAVTTRAANFYTNSVYRLRGAVTINGSPNDVCSNRLDALFIRSNDFTASPAVTGPVSPNFPLSNLSLRTGVTGTAAIPMTGWYTGLFVITQCNSAAHTMENVADMILGGSLIGNGAQITNKYGIYLNPINSFPNVTNAYGIYQTGTTDFNFFAGKTRVGHLFTTSTAYLHLGTGTAAASTAPLKFTAGTNLTTPENGAMEFDGTNLYITIAGVRRTIQVV